MALTRTQARARVLQRADATGSSRWDSTAVTGEVDQALGTAVDREWRRLLDQVPSLRLESVSVTSSATTGRYSLSDLDTGSGNSAHRFHRVQAFIVDNIPYREAEFTDYSMGESLGLNLNVYWREGDYIMTLPKTLSKAATVWRTHLPVRVESLAADSDTITYPEGYHEIYLLEAAALLLAKGGAETGAAAELKALAKDLREEMLQHLARFSKNPLQWRYGDEAADWGG